MTRRSPTLVRTLVVLAASALSFSARPALASVSDATALSAHAAARAQTISAPRIWVTPSLHDFGTVLLGEIASRDFTVTNTGDQNLTVTSITSSDPQFTILTPVPFTLAPASGRAVSVRFTPTLSAPAGATISFQSNGENNPFAVEAIGQGTTVPLPPLGAGTIVIAPTGEAGGDQLGLAVAGVGDVNGDGFQDFLATAWTHNVGLGDEGRAYLYLGGASMDDVPDLVLDGQGFRDNFGTSASGAGDFNADGFADFIVGAWMNDAGGTDAGRAYLYYGGPSMDEFPDRVFTGVGMGDLFGREVTGAGDVNGDGFADVAVGAHANDAGGANAGRVYVYFGGPASDTVADWILTGAAAEDRFGYTVSSAGDLNRDGYGDLIVGAYANDAGGPDAGRAYVYFGGVAPDAAADWVLTGEASGDRFGVEVHAAGDLNGDQYPDVIVGADYNGAGGFRAGRAYLYWGGVAPDAVPDVVFTGHAAGANFGFAVSAAGDMDGDGFGDLVIGSWLYNGDSFAVGRADVYLGGPSMDAVSDLTLIGERADDRLGNAVAGLGDVNGDGRSEIALGAYYHDTDEGEAGRAYVVSMEAGDLPPAVTAPAEWAAVPGTLLAFQVTASDPDGDAIVSLTASPLPEGATFTPSAGNTSGDFAWTPGDGQAGTHVVVFTASNSRTGSAATTITVGSGNLRPILSAPSSIFGSEGVAIAFEVSATDPEGGHVTLGIAGRPVGALFIDLGNNTGTFSWTPGFGQAGSYSVTFTGNDESGAAAEPKSVAITVDGVNRAPTASPGGPYAGVIHSFITFDGTASADPDGDPLAYEWAFGDAASATGPNPLHAYGLGGVFTVTLRVSDGTASHTASTYATIQDVFQAGASLDAGNRTTRLQSGKATTCVQIEPVGGSYANTNVDLATIEMISIGTGSLDRIFAIPGKTTIGSDRDRNGVDEITACFSKDDLRLLFGGLSGGKHTVGVTLEGDLLTGGRFHATLEMDVVVSGGPVAVAVAPNPLNPTGVLTLRAAGAGRVNVRLFDLNGRLVRTLLEGSFPSGGYHDVPIDGRRDDGSPLGSGIYFYRVETEEGTVAGRIAIVK